MVTKFHLVPDYEDPYGVNVVRTRSPPTDHDDGGPFTDVTLSFPLLDASDEALFHVLGPVLLTGLAVEKRMHTSVQVTLGREE